jgi:hypothetical protein
MNAEKRPTPSEAEAWDAAKVFLSLLAFPPRTTLDGAAAELERELLVRDRCYGRWVSEGRLARQDAADRYNRMQAALATVKLVLDQYPEDAVQVPYGSSGDV